MVSSAAKIFGGSQTSCPASNSSCESKYSYAPFQNTFCGSNGCAFLDTSGSFPIQPEIGVLPYFINCTLSRERIHYSADFRGYFPDVCTKAKNASFLYGYGSYMTDKAFGSHDPDTNASYIVAPRRRITFTFAKVVWELKNLDKEYNASCGHVSLDTNASAVNCAGLAYQLQPSGRFLFAGKTALPNDVLRGTSFRSPIPLVQLNSPTIEVDGKLATIERLDPQNFAFYNSSRLKGNKCSLVMDSYLKHVDGNNYFLERPLQAMATSFFYFLMENAAITDLKNVSLVLDTKTVNKTATIDRLGNVRLKGDLQLRNIRVSIPWESFRTTIVGCVCICIGTIVIICVPARRVKHCTANTTRAEQFVAMRKDADYPDDVHDKLLVFPATGERVRFADLAIEALALAHISLTKATLSKSIQKKDSEQSESESDASHASTLDEIT